MISGSTGPIFTMFSSYGRYLIVEYRFDPLFSMAQGTLSWQPILGSKSAKSDYLPLFVALAFRKRLQCRHCDLKVYLWWSGCTVCCFCLRGLSACIQSFLILWDKLSPDLLDWFSPNFHHMEVFDRTLRTWSFSDRLKDVAVATNFSIKIGELGLFTFIRRPGIRKQIAISHFWLFSWSWIQDICIAPFRENSPPSSKTLRNGTC